jgi:hypothetical protein
MPNTYRLVLIGIVLGTAACSGTDSRQWMKVDQRYTTAEFQRDYAECSASKTLDDTCMKNRGWIEVNRSKSEQDQDPRAQEPPRGRPTGSTPMGGHVGVGAPK